MYQKIAKLSAGDYFGELALIDHEKGVRRARITCASDCALATLHADKFKVCIERIEKKKREEKF